MIATSDQPTRPSPLKSGQRRPRRGVAVADGGRGGDGVRVGVDVAVGRSGVFVGGTGVFVGGTGVSVGVSVGVLVGVAVGVLVSVGDAVGVFVGVAVGGEPIQMFTCTEDCWKLLPVSSS